VNMGNVKPEAPSWHIGWKSAVGLAALSVFMLTANWKAIAWLWASWTQLPEYSHGPLMPFIAAFLIWQRHDRIQQTEFTGSYWGIALIGISGITLLAGTVGAVYTLQQYSLLAIFIGVTLTWTGLKSFRHFVMPFVVLALMIPQPEFILAQLSAKLQLISSTIGVAMIRAVGISVFLEGNIIDLGTYKLQVVDACAGLRYLFPLMTIGLLVAYFFRAPMWQRVFLFFASIPVTILMNSFRIATVGLMVDRWGIEMAEGFIHDFQGWVVFMMSTLLMMGIAGLLHAASGATTPWSEVFGIDFPPKAKRAKNGRIRYLPRSLLVGMAAGILVCIVEIVVPERPAVIPKHPPMATFPLSLNQWHGSAQSLGEDVIASSAMDDYFLATYSADAGVPVSLYISYYDSQRDRRVVHSPAVCLPGSGWHFVDSSVAQPSGTEFRVNRIVIANGEHRALVYYWFDQRGRFVTNEWLVKWYLFHDALLSRKTYGAMVRVMTPMLADESPEHAQVRLDDFLRAARPDLLTFIPR